jgi:hypothetical protein
MHIRKNNYQQLWGWGLIILMLLGLGLKLLFIEHPLESDDTSYMALSKWLSVENFSHPNSQLYFRIGILLPLHVLIRIFGYSIFTYYLFSVGFSMLLLFSILLLTKELFGLKIAMLTGVMYISSSLIGIQSTNLLPDTPAFFWAVLSVYFFIRYVSDTRTKYSLFLAALSGFIAYLCKEPVLVFFVVIPLYEYYKSKSIKRTLYFATLLILFWIVESAGYWILSGDFLIRIKTFSKGVSNWIVYQPEVSLVDFLLTSPINILKTTNGKILLIFGLIGGVLAFLRNNSKIKALLTGGILIYIIYTYSFYNLNPLIPSLPPKFRYITGFFCVLSIVSAWTLVTLYQYFRKLIPTRYLQLGFGGIIITIFLLQSIENYSNKNTVLFHKNTYFIANRLLKEKFPIPIQDSIYAIPRNDFLMYSNFGKLHLIGLSKIPVSPCYLLYSKNRLVKSLYYAEKKKNDSLINFYQNLLHHVDSITILEYDGIVFSYVRSFNPSFDTLVKFSNLSLDGLIWAEKTAFRISRDIKRQFNIDILNEDGKSWYFYTFRSKFNEAPGYDSTMIPFLKRNQLYRIVIEATTEKKLDQLTIILSECDAKKRICDHHLYLGLVKSGENKWEFDFRSASDAKKIKLYFKVMNSQPDNRIIIKDIILLGIN